MRNVFLLIVLCACAFVSQAQIVNIENQRLLGKKQGWSGNIDLGFSLIKNTSQITQLNNRNRVSYRFGRNTLTGITDLSYVRVNKENHVNSGFQHLRYAYQTRRFERIYLEGFQQTQYNKIQLINLRLLLGAGARAVVLDYDSAAVNVGVFLMGEYEQQTGGIQANQLRYSCFLSYDFQFSKTTGINAIVYYQPDFFSPSDYRVAAEAALRMRIIGNLRFRISYNLTHDSSPPEGAPQTIYSIQNAFVYEF